ncbi:MAG: Excinuclease ABC subunit A paralog of unknown function [uncultured Sulfurovum sp.]|uniref:UvrABC system protein A n=1 Tax=uncultured Sulfurovum sp. TaxID=269237 RepID=A0A6S6SU94_9BACT|nr:MAG: Excinuclease ABC subunit A paralog of unknown function [uncultured Sulfurovum sp.]
MIKIIKASENNLKNISVNIPQNKITSVIGVSGSGKSTLLYNVMANESQRREKIDSGNATCVDLALRAKFDSIENLPYCITLKQRGLSQSISATISTITKLHELLREEFVKYGDIKGINQTIITKPTINGIIEFIKKYHLKTKFEYFAVVCQYKYTNGINELKILRENNIKEAIFISSFDNKERIKKVSSVKNLSEKYHHTLLVPINELEDIKQYEQIALEDFYFRSKDIEFDFHIDYPDLDDGKIYQKKSVELLSFNSISIFGGKCKECNGHGNVESIDWDSLINKNKRLNEPFLVLEDNGKECYKYIGLCFDSIAKIIKKEKIDTHKSFFEIDSIARDIVKNIIAPKILKHQAKVTIGKFVKTITCPTCHGTRLNYKANAIKLHNKSISELLEFKIDELYEFLKEKDLHHKKVLTILESLKLATLGYLTLDRSTDTLSGGELQRLKFAIELNGEYKNLLYILDEPSTGLHPYNNFQMINLIQELKNRGNTIIISEHNQDYIQNSDYIIELGEGSGKSGGKVIYTGDKKEFNQIEYQRKRLKVNLNYSIELNGVSANNIINEDFKIPLNCLVAISGISGSGKSSLIHKVLVPILQQYIEDKSYDNSLVQSANNLDKIEAIVELTQSQIGINSRSIVATYLNIFDKIRDIFATTEVAKEFNFDKSYFSFNSSSGACETCNGSAEVEDQLCSTCLGDRYKAEVLEVKYNNSYNIIELLNLTIEELRGVLDDEKLIFTIDILEKLGLSHLTLGRTTPTLSGGEAQRLKFAKTIIESYKKIKKGNFLFILDEPTTGLNGKDILRIYDIFKEILFYENSIIIIEHNLNIIKNSDYIIDIGLGSGKDGGKNLFSGSYEELVQHKESFTAKAFREEFKEYQKILFHNFNLKEKVYKKKELDYCHSFYLDEKHFQIEKEFSKKYIVKTDKEQHKYFRTKKELFTFAKTLIDTKIFFNPYTSKLFKYKIVPLSIKKERLKHLKKLKFNIATKDYEKDEWNYRVEIDNLEKAYNFGNGWVSIESEGTIYNLFTRFVSIKNKIIGSPTINEHTFNLYLNSCQYCKAKGTLEAYRENLIIADDKKSILEDGFLYPLVKIKLRDVRSAINKFKKEEIFDFSRPFNQFSEEEKNIFLFGFKEYKFLKPKGRVNALGDYISWKGLYYYVYENLSKVPNAKNIKESQYSKKCPFCDGVGIDKEVNYYLKDQLSISSYL